MQVPKKGVLFLSRGGEGKEIKMNSRRRVNTYLAVSASTISSQAGPPGGTTGLQKGTRHSRGTAEAQQRESEGAVKRRDCRVGVLTAEQEFSGRQERKGLWKPPLLLYPVLFT